MGRRRALPAVFRRRGEERARRRHLPFRSDVPPLLHLPLFHHRVARADQHQWPRRRRRGRSGRLRALQRPPGPGVARREAHRAGRRLAAVHRGPRRHAAQRPERSGAARRRQHLLHRHRLGRAPRHAARADGGLPRLADRRAEPGPADAEAERHRAVARRRGRFTSAATPRPRSGSYRSIPAAPWARRRSSSTARASPAGSRSPTASASTTPETSTSPTTATRSRRSRCSTLRVSCWGESPFPSAPSNCTFGGADRRTLYVTTLHAVYEVRVPVPGLP